MVARDRRSAFKSRTAGMCATITAATERLRADFDVQGEGSVMRRVR
jgi:hypothetical protein